MPNRSYEIGKRFEYRVRDHAIACGCLAMQAGGSKGIAAYGADLLVFSAVDAWAVSCKVGDWPTPAERDALRGWSDVGVTPLMVARIRPRLILYRFLAEDGSMAEPVTAAPWAK